MNCKQILLINRLVNFNFEAQLANSGQGNGDDNDKE